MALTDAVSVGLLECRRGRIAAANAAMVALAAVQDAAALVGRSPDALVRDAGEGLPDWLGGEVQEARTEPVECELVRAGGPCARVRVHPLGRGWFEFEDVTSLRTLEAAVHRLGRELQRANQTCEALRDHLEAESKQRAELLSVVSHEIQTPLTVLAGFTRLLLREEAGPLNEEQRRFLGESARSCRRLQRFLSSVFQAEGLHRTGSSADLSPSSISSTVHAVVELMSPLVRERGQRIELRLAEDADRARFDPMRIEQVLINLLSNALKYGRSGGTIDVATRRIRTSKADFVEVAVRDDGPGVAESDRKRIFEPYVRAGSSPEGEGLGLGLAICRRIVEDHGGVIRVEVASGGGSRFVFTLEAGSERGEES